MHGTAFAEALDQALGDLAAEPPLPHVPPARRAAPPHPFLFAATPFWNHARDAAPMAAAVRPARPAASSPEPPRAPRAMTPAERRAFDGLNTLGARLAPDFGPRDLRSAFRTLARRYHPDRHPSSTDAEKARLARLFAELTDHHRRLVALVYPAQAVRH